MSITVVEYVAGSIVAAVAAFAVIVIGMERVTAPYSERSLDAQRDDLAMIVAIALNPTGVPGDGSRRSFDQAFARARLRQDVGLDWPKVFRAINVMRESVWLRPSPDEVTQLAESVIEMSQLILSADLARIQRGGSWLYFAKWALPLMIFTSGVIIAYGRGFIIIR